MSATEGDAASLGASVAEGWLEEQIRRYRDLQGQLEQCASTVEAILRAAARRRAPIAIVQSRVKSVASFAQKAQRKNQGKEEFHNPLSQITDLCGARVITLTEAEKRAVCEFIEESFDIDLNHSISEKQRHRPWEFGYRSTHYVVQFVRGKFPSAEVPAQVPAELYPAPDDPSAHWPVRIEIQVRTYLEHVWAAFTHERSYKRGFELPQDWQRELHLLSATLESTDAAFTRLERSLLSYYDSGKTSLKPEEVEQETSVLRTVLKYEPDRRNHLELLLRLARLAKARGDQWEEQVIQDLAPYAEERGEEWAEVWLELGRAYCRKQSEPTNAADRGDGLVQKGQQLLCRAAGLPSSTLDEAGGLAAGGLRPTRIQAAAMHFLARSLRQGHGKQELASGLLQRAHTADPDNPYFLAAYLEDQVCRRGDLAFVELLSPALAAGATTCRSHADVKIEGSLAYFTLGLFQLLLGRTDEAMGAYAKGIQLSPGVGHIREALASIQHFEAAIALQKPELVWVSRLLEAGVVAKHCQLRGNAAKGLDEANKTVADRKAALKKLRAQDGATPESLREAKASLASATEGLEKAKQKLTEAEAILSKARQSLRALALHPSPEWLSPVVIVAGGADPKVQRTMEAYQLLLEGAFHRFRGTIFSGGTATGIPGIMGGIREKLGATEDEVMLVGYLPKQLPERPDAQADGRYVLYRTDWAQDNDFTLAQPIQNWIDLLARGADPAEVRLLGINGGRIAEFEYKVALAFGATVGLFETSGRAIGNLKHDPDWKDEPNRIWLIEEEYAVRAFVNPGQLQFDAQRRNQIEKAARANHKDFRKQNRHKNPDPTMQPYDQLRPDLRASNFGMIAYAWEILRVAGYGVRPARADAEPIAFRDKEVEEMARMEHGRYVVERLLAGWRFGPKRAPENKINPCLCKWEELPKHDKDAQDYTRQTVKKWPRLLLAEGLEVYKLSPFLRPL